MKQVMREVESADHLDLLGSSCLMLTRTSILLKPLERRAFAPSVRELAIVLDDLAKELGNYQMLQGAADRALEIARRIDLNSTHSKSRLAAYLTVQMVAADILVFAGVNPE